MITFPNSVKDVANIVKAARDFHLRVVPRSGGHSYIANNLGGRDGAVVVDLKNMTDVVFDPADDTVRVETGNKLGDIALVLNGVGRAIPHGTCPYVGIGGHAGAKHKTSEYVLMPMTFAGHGGFGFTSRMWGLTVDNIVSLEVVLADGSIKQASRTVNSDLFWVCH